MTVLYRQSIMTIILSIAIFLGFFQISYALNIWLWTWVNAINTYKSILALLFPTNGFMVEFFFSSVCSFTAITLFWYRAHGFANLLLGGWQVAWAFHLSVICVAHRVVLGNCRFVCSLSKWLAIYIFLTWLLQKRFHIYLDAIRKIGWETMARVVYKSSSGCYMYACMNVSTSLLTYYKLFPSLDLKYENN